MLRKYFPFIALLAAASFLFWIKSNQRGKSERIQVSTDQLHVISEPFVRDTSILVYSKHALCRMECRQIDASEVKEILQKGELNYEKISEDAKGKTYPLEGVTHDRQHVRIVFAPHKHELVVVTVIDLDHEWECNCN